MVSAEDNFFFDAIFVLGEKVSLLEEIHHAPFLVKTSPLIVGVIAIAIAYVFYLLKTDLPNKFALALKPFYKISYNKWYFDEIYEVLWVNSAKKLGNFLWRIIDVKFVDGVPNGAAAICRFVSCRVSKLQTGYIYNYSFWMVIGVIAISFFLISSFKQIGIIN